MRRYAAVLLGLCWLLASSPAQPTETPETVMVTLHARPGSEQELARVIARHWQTAERMKLVRDTPHLTLRGSEDGSKAYFVEIFTWRDGRIPDSAPSEIREIWNDMNRLVEPRAGHAGLEFVPVSIAAPATAL